MLSPVTSGNNDWTDAHSHTDYTAASGWNAATGLGIPVATGLLCPQPTSSSSHGATPGTSVTITGTDLANSTVYVRFDCCDDHFVEPHDESADSHRHGPERDRLSTDHGQQHDGLVVADPVLISRPHDHEHELCDIDSRECVQFLRDDERLPDADAVRNERDAPLRRDVHR